MDSCDVSKNDKILLNNICKKCNLVYGLYCLTCNSEQCLSCTYPAPYMRPHTKKCETCDLANTDLKIEDQKLCYQTPGAQINSILSRYYNNY